jgi:hypothetical protein
VPGPEHDAYPDLAPLREQFIAGEPAQVMIEISDAIQVAVPDGVWQGVADLYYQPAQQGKLYSVRCRQWSRSG